MPVDCISDYEQIEIPEGFPEILREYCKETIRRRTLFDGKDESETRRAMISWSVNLAMATSYHDLHTPIARATISKYIGTSVAGKLDREYASSDVRYSSEIVDAIAYYFDNAEDMSSHEEPAGDVAWEISSTWKLLLEIYGIEMIHEACMTDPELVSEVPENHVRHAFSTSKAFRRLVAVLKWLNWVNSFEEVPHVDPSSSAYPLSNAEYPIDTSLRAPEKLHGKDLQRERTLCRAVWTLLTQGKVAEAIELCSASGHHWRAGVMQAAVGVDEDDYFVDYDKSRFAVKEIARQICNSKSSCSDDPFDVAITAFLCGEEAPMRRVLAGKNFCLNLWASLYCLKEQCVAHIMGEGGQRAFGQTDEEFDKILAEEMESILSSQAIELDSTNQFGVIQIAIIIDQPNAAINVCRDWVSDQILRINATEWDVDLTNPVAAVLLRSFSANLVTVYRDIIGHRCDEESVSLIIQSQIESLIAQYKNQLSEGNELITETIALLQNFDQQVHTWAWYLKQYMSVAATCEVALAALVDVFPNGVLPVLNLLMDDLISKHLAQILALSAGSYVSGGAEVKFGIEAANTVWLLIQGRAKSHGSGIYLDVVQDEENEPPEEAAQKTITAFANIVGAGLLVLLLADFNSAKLVAHDLNASKGKILSIYSAVVENDEETHFLLPLFSFIHILDRVGGIMERSSLLEQQQTNLAKLSSKTGRSVGTETRRQILETQRQITSTSEMIAKLVDEITQTLSEYLQETQCPLLCDNVPLVAPVVPAVVEVLIESAVQAVALFDDRKKHDSLANAVRESTWIPSVIPKRRLKEILDEIN